MRDRRARAERDKVHARGRGDRRAPAGARGAHGVHPALPAARDQLTQRIRQGNLTKVARVYDTPFWREKGLNGTAVSTDGQVEATFDDSPPTGRPGVIFGFVGGDAAREFRGSSEAERRDRRARATSPRTSGTRPRSPEEYFETAGRPRLEPRRPGRDLRARPTLTAYGPALRRPVGRVHWAGTETATYWNGYMDGAIRSGERAAKEVLEEL